MAFVHAEGTAHSYGCLPIYNNVGLGFFAPIVFRREVSLNGKILRLVGDQIPQLEPLQEEASSSLSLPPLSFGFYVFKDVLASACTESG